MAQIVYWRRELPPLSQQIEGEHEALATSEQVHASWADRDALWHRCYLSLAAAAERRIAQEVVRLGGSCAHVVSEQVTTKRDDANETMWLVGLYRFVMYVAPPAP
ncbi:MAG: hypothetical protein IPL61_20730 [Myxococcales bacterium]|nr:hypothetical protein [Myxococcales bacterium]